MSATQLAKKIDPYKGVQNRKDYNKLLESGMFWEFYPEFSGDWEEDQKIIAKYYESKKKNFISKYVGENTFYDIGHPPQNTHEYILNKTKIKTIEDIVDILSAMNLKFMIHDGGSPSAEQKVLIDKKLFKKL